MADQEDKQWFETQGASSGKRRKSARPASRKNSPKTSPSDKRRNNRASGNTKRTDSNFGGIDLHEKASGHRKNDQKKDQKKEQHKPVYTQAGDKPHVKGNGKSVNNDRLEKQNKAAKSVKSDKTNIKTKPAAVTKTKTDLPVKDKSEKKPETDDYTKKQRKRARKKILNKSIIGVAVVFLSLMILVFVIYHLNNYIAAKPEFMFVSEGSVEHTIGARALIVRDETVVNGTYTGDLVTQATEGSRVSKDQRIAMVVPADMTSTVESLRNTQNQISEVQQELIQSGSADGADAIYSNINAGIEPIVDMIRLDAMNGNLSDMSSYAASLSVLITQREGELAQLDFDDERLKVLRDDEASYETMLQRSAHRVTAPCPGIISFKLDGREGDLSFDYLLSADAGEIRSVINNSVGIITSDLYIDENEAIARVARNEEQYIAVFLDSGDASQADFEPGSLHTLNVGSEGVVIDRCEVVRSTTTSDGLLIVFSTTRYVEDLLDLRTVDIEIVISEKSGLKVPISSLVDADYDRGVASIYINNQGFADEVGVIIEDYDREFAIIAPIGDSSIPNTQTVIITNPSSIKPGEKVTN